MTTWHKIETEIKANSDVTPCILDNHGLGILKVEGPDAAKFLQGQVSADMAEVTQTQCRLASYNNIKGRIIASFWIVAAGPDCYLLLMPQAMIDIMLEKIAKFAIFSKVELSKASAEYQINAIHAGSELTALSAKSIETDILLSITNNLFLFISKQAFTGLDNKQDTWQHHLINAGIALVVPETSEEFTPHDLNYPALKAVSFKKGCYVGQEIIARMQFRGTLKKHLYRAQITPSLAVGTELHTSNGQLYGYVASIAGQDALLVITSSVKDEAVFLQGDNSQLLISDLTHLHTAAETN